MKTYNAEEIKVILSNHSKWLADEEGGVKADFGDVDLREADLRGAYLRSANLGSADLRGVNLGGANLGGADLGGANLGGADLGGANLRDADLRGANLGSADLCGAYLQNTGILTFQFEKHQAIYTPDGTLTIGCHVLPITEWSLGFKKIGQAEGYTALQVKSYGNFIKSCLEVFNETDI